MSQIFRQECVPQIFVQKLSGWLALASEAEFLDVTEFPPCYSQSPLLQIPPPPFPRKSVLKLVCNVNIVETSSLRTLKIMAQNPQCNCTFMNSPSGLLSPFLAQLPASFLFVKKQVKGRKQWEQMMGVRKVAKFSYTGLGPWRSMFIWNLNLQFYVLPFQVCMNQKLGDLTNREHAPNVGRCLLCVLYSKVVTERASLRQYNDRTITS